ncbi:hypothetical protein Noda2021_01070 [Candidatus Dependentiae bacterium Noda2021]|nr:hypothetical protein Noda2021_01070 [Candidatus Dependentiae bacterium Noda2021]
MRQILLFSILVAINNLAGASIEVDIPKTQGFVSRYSHTFELKNKDKKPITVQLYEVRPDDQRLLFDKSIKTIVRFGVGYLRLDPEYHLLLKITDNAQKQSTFIIRPDNKTLSVLVKYTSGRLEPQIGTYAGMSGYTTSGLPLINNIKPTQIEKNS